MMKSSPFCLVFAALFGFYSSSPALAQAADTTSAWRYYPLQIGNVWEYEGLGSISHVTDYRIEVESDTLIEGQHYFILTHDALDCSPCIDRFTVRFDVEVGRMVERISGGEEVPWWYANCELDTPFGSETACGEVTGGYEETFELADGSVLEGVTYKVFDSGFERHGYIADVGFVTEAILQMEPGEARLRYARVGGVEYGEPFPVAAESAPSEAAVALTIFPNPLRGAVTARLSLDAPQRVTLAVYDVLGRRVLAGDLGVQPSGEVAHRLDLGGLPAGLYVVRLDGDAGAQATARIVRH